MNIQKPPLPLADEPGRQHPHETGEADQLDTMQFEQHLHRTLELLAPGVNLVIDDGAGDVVFLGEGQSGRVRPVRQHKDDFGREGRVRRAIDKGPHVGAAAGNKDRRAFAPEGHNASRPE